MQLQSDNVHERNVLLRQKRQALLLKLNELERNNKVDCENLFDVLRAQHGDADQAANRSNRSSRSSRSGSGSNSDSDTPAAAEYQTFHELQEYQMPQITESMSDEKQRQYLSLLLRYMCVSNTYQRNEIQRLYAKQTSLYLMAQGLALDEQRQFHDALAGGDKQQQTTSMVEQVLCKYPDAHQIADSYEQYVKSAMNININERTQQQDSLSSRLSDLRGAPMTQFDDEQGRLRDRERCDVANVICAFQNTHTTHSKLRHKVATLAENNKLNDYHYGFDLRYTDGGMYAFDGVLEDEHRIRRNYESMTPAAATATVTAPVDHDMGGAAGWLTLNQFIHLATNFGAHGQRDAQVLVLTHKTFTESTTLLKGFCKRFWMPMPANLTPTEMAAFRTTYVKQIRGKIIAVLRWWLTKHWKSDFRDSFLLQQRMQRFIERINKTQSTQAMCIWLAQVFDKQKKVNAIRSLVDDNQLAVAQQAQIAQKKKVVKFFYDTKTIDILDFKPQETAACITELNCTAFLSIDQRECFEWIKHKEKAPHVAQMIARWNATGNWAQRELLSRKRNFKTRLAVLRMFINIVSILSDWGDFSGAYAINSAIHSTPIHRLKRYFSELTKKEHNTLKEKREMFDVSGNYPNLRAKMKHYLSKPCVPHIGLFTRDFTMLAEQPSTKMVDGVKYISYPKCQALAKQIGDLKMYQNNSNKFKLRYQKPLLDYVETQLENPLISDNELYNMSVNIEPPAKSVM